MSQPEIQIRPAIDVSNAVREVIDDLCQCLREPVLQPKKIHRIRVNIKRLRAWVRLVKHAADNRTLHNIDKNLKQISGQFSRNRDNHVISELLARLLKKKDKDKVRFLIQTLNNQQESKPDETEKNKPGNITLSINQIEQLQQQCILLNRFNVIKKGLKKTYERTLKSGQEAFGKSDSFIELHELRKWVKYLCYQIEFIRAWHPEQYQLEQKRLDKLGRKLGEINDLIMVKDLLENMKTPNIHSDTVDLIKNEVFRNIKILNKKSTHLFNNIFNQTPSAFVKNLKS